MTLGWRPMVVDDLDRVAGIAAIGFPDHFEGRDCFENRLALYPSGCFVLAGPDGVEAYLISYPWRRGSTPALNTCIEAIPPDADLLYLHDLALHPDVRGHGMSAPILERLADDARAQGWPAIALVAVNDAAGFWRRRGFETVDEPALADRPAGYGPDARYMIRPL